MDKNKIILIAIAVLVIILIALGAYIASNGNDDAVENITIENKTQNNTVIMIDKDGNVTNDTAVDDNSTGNDTNTTNQTYRVYNPQSDSYVTVIGEGYDDEFNRWYTYDTDGVRYYNTRIK
ncbi:hypothetical protein [Methanobrevibacter sp.]|uniref:hypothetical protein n=1 Tax=Methanobrevibacter sp. TaxID=66852 RepID=UPI0025DF8F81|nr:hypothetical protein [Methanobrevibacter sp.]MBQ2666043.1 hypothetical protein [Methanobrevibacter sp.]